jgi:hypothetical protein
MGSNRGKVATAARFEVFTAVTMKNGVFWDVKPCGEPMFRRNVAPLSSG